MPRTTQWRVCNDSHSITGLEHGVAYSLEVVATDKLGNSGNKSNAAAWTWAVDDMFLDKFAGDEALTISSVLCPLPYDIYTDHHIRT